MELRKIPRDPIQGATPLMLFTGQPVAQPGYKMDSVFPSGTNRTLACSARAQDTRVCVE